MSNITPEKTFKMNEKDYTLQASMRVLKDLQKEFGHDVYDLAQGVILQFRFDQLARAIAIGIGEDKAPDALEIEEWIIRHHGLDQTKLLLMEWIVRAVSQESDREKNVQGLLENIAMMTDATAAIKSMMDTTEKLEKQS